MKNKEKIIIWVNTLGVVALLLTYIGLVNLSAHSAASRENALEQAGLLRTEVALLEESYLNLSSRITLGLAHDLGFHDIATESSYAARSSVGGTVGLMSVANEI